MSISKDPEKRLKLMELAGRDSDQASPVIGKSEPPKISSERKVSGSNPRARKPKENQNLEDLDQVYAVISNIQSGTARKNDKDVRRTVRFTKETMTAIDFYSEQSMVGIALVLEEAIREWIKGPNFQGRLKSALEKAGGPAS